MSRILTAVSKAHSEVSQVLEPMIAEQAPVSASPAEDDAAVRAVLDDGTDFLPGARRVITSSRIRQVSLRIPAGQPVLPFDGTNLGVADQYRIIRTKLVHDARQPRILLVSSAGPSDGKTITAINIAGALALKSETKVALLDTDFRRSTIHSRLGIPSSPGLADVLAGSATLEQAIVCTEQLPNLFVMSAGEPVANPSELLDSSRWTRVCADLRSMFRFVVADSPPVASVADYDLLQATCDGVLLVARPDHTSRPALLKVLETIPKDKLIGVVMNCVESWLFSRHQSYASYYGNASDSSEKARR